ncbi:MAG: hypothetical protein IPK17_17970 [Chloroflexi bacterium]|uniref:hypothetical protein n=1 Tax=Candidatus Flexifilum breve TaxID=3140694 RepID=UPI00313599CE|nr:hypothetical protein [Chloroflexota bacterium]
MTILHEADVVGTRPALPLRWIKQHRLRIIHAGILATFALIPVWYRFTSVPPLFPPLYVSNFLILLPMLFTITAWVIMGVPGLRDLRRSRWGRWWTLALLLLAPVGVRLDAVGVSAAQLPGGRADGSASIRDRGTVRGRVCVCRAASTTHRRDARGRVCAQRADHSRAGVEYGRAWFARAGRIFLQRGVELDQHFARG